MTGRKKELVTPTDDHQSRKKYFAWPKKKGEKKGAKEGGEDFFKNEDKKMTGKEKVTENLFR